ncbi:hypothetical protein Dvina_51495 [Dactylosporangium vinaceum]|uniref:hypothetical protein n=1 Tax=Dactylosporangium vinaceum TaxID=53362 RepID=UPI001CAA068B|nr:hypothetical protein [Dactylosporangium vinaceum]UAB96272.1 hypothetical protein Dvina_51495 [Dactylosporangium vinaceum]
MATKKSFNFLLCTDEAPDRHPSPHRVSSSCRPLPFMLEICRRLAALLDSMIS